MSDKNPFETWWDITFITAGSGAHDLVEILGTVIDARRVAEALRIAGHTNVEIRERTNEIMDEFGISKDDDGRYWCECRSCGRKYELEIDASDLLDIDDRTPLVCGGSERCLP